MASHPRYSTRAQLKCIFPGGFDEVFGLNSKISLHSSRSWRGSHYSLTPEQLYHSLVERYDPITAMESVMVKSAWYGKQTHSAQHEFIVVQVQDIYKPALVNYLILDRNVVPHAGLPIAQFQTTLANDTFKISYDGDLERLVQESRLKPCKYIEELLFPPDSQLHLYELVILADIVSLRYPNYHLLDSSCYMHAGLIWECMRLMRPFAGYRGGLRSGRGKLRWFRYTSNESDRQNTYREVRDKITAVEKSLWGAEIVGFAIEDEEVRQTKETEEIEELEYICKLVDALK
ncbi:hypothetical protein BDV93DRAFT_557989 [Ceratobasidium sp. AG-I]|nr:hypothetical protein BDV93DRAFT_557989 [Ceratobasidium sp. AG-I]